MKTFFYYSIYIFVILNIFSCSGINFTQWHFPYTMEVEQGKYLTQDQINQIHVGMNKNQINYIVGQPLTQFIFNQQRWDFLYQDYKNGKLIKSYTFTILFDKNNVAYNISQTGKFFEK